MSRQDYYAGRKERERRQVDARLALELVGQERRVQPRLGVRKLYHMIKGELRAAGVKLGRDRLFSELRQRSLLVPRLRREFPQTTQSYHCLPVFKNLINRREVQGPNEVWVSDLTYLRTREGYLYLALTTDKYSRKIVGHNAGETLEARGCVQALEMALAQTPAGCKPIHHSDRGIQYCCHEYVNRLQAHGMSISMSEHDHCAENALAERVNGILKQEYALGGEFLSKDQAREAVTQAINLYNTRRPHTELGYRFPEDVHRQGANLTN